MLHHKSRGACVELIYVRNIFAELWPLTLRILTHFSLSSQLLLHVHPFMDLNDTWQECDYQSRSACGEIIHVHDILAELCPLTLRTLTYFSLSSQLLLHPCMVLNETWQGCCTTNLEVHVGR